MGDDSLRSNDAEAGVSLFDSVENYLRAMDTTAKLCGEAESEHFDEDEIQRFSSSITFIREWRHFNYERRTVKFACEMESSPGKRNVSSGFSLPQYSSATVSKNVEPHESTSSSESSQDFVMYVGGSVWALDWCPRVHDGLNGDINCEFIAVAAHPPDSNFHKLGAQLTGRGMVQIWCVLNVRSNEVEVLLPKKNLKRKPQNSEEDKSTEPKKPRGRPRKVLISTEDAKLEKTMNLRERPKKKPIYSEETNDKFEKPIKPKGRPRKNPVDEPLPDVDVDIPSVPALAIQYPDESFVPLSIEGVAVNSEEYMVLINQDKEKRSGKVVSSSSSAAKLPIRQARSKARGSNNQKDTTISLGTLVSCNLLDSSPPNVGIPMHSEENIVPKNQYRKEGSETVASLSSSTTKLLITYKRSKTRARGNDGSTVLPFSKIDERESSINNQKHPGFGLDSLVSNNLKDRNPPALGLPSCSIPEDIARPRIVLGLAHNGKVAWDLKWRPYNLSDINCKQRMGYLAVLLGNGSLEVWEIPFPRTMRAIYSSSSKDGTDPRFVKLEPVFRCSMLKSGDTQSIPLTLEWSPLSRPDFILVGCHDGTVAMWKFSPSSSPKDTRPLLRFSADTAPIRAISWAPAESDPENANVILTGGQGGLKFWDIRDPFRPLWDITMTRFIYSLDWLPDPRCVVISFDDGTLRIISLANVLNDVPVPGKRCTGAKPTLSLFNYSSFATWSVQVSRQTGVAAYCSADGTVLCFQLTVNAVEKDSRYRPSHFLSWFLTEEESTYIVNTPLPNNPLKMKKMPISESGEAPRSMRSLLADSNQTKNINNKKPNNTQARDTQHLGVCYDSDPTVEEQRGHKKNQKTKDVNAEVKEKDKKENENETLVFPSKMVAMQRVRWNMNKGSERWLCSGGAAGILRVQKIILPQIKTKSQPKK